MKEYHKIQTVYKRDPKTRHKTLLEGRFSLPEFEYLQSNEWLFTEKVDGTNVRVLWDGATVRFGGKTDNSQMTMPLMEAIKDMFPAKGMTKVFGDSTSVPDGETFGVCLYGEGYGGKIEKGGKYRQDQSFVLFDVKVGEWWLQWRDVKDVSAKLGVGVVPIIGSGTLREMVEKTRVGFDSRWGDFTAEGIVARPSTELRTRNGKRMITKIKHKDFQREVKQEQAERSEQ